MVMYAGGGESRTWGRAAKAPQASQAQPAPHFVGRLPRNVLALLLDVGEDADLDGPVAEGDLDDVADLDRVAGLGGLAVDQHAPGVGDLIGEGAALDDAADL